MARRCHRASATPAERVATRHVTASPPRRLSSAATAACRPTSACRRSSRRLPTGEGVCARRAPALAGAVSPALRPAGRARRHGLGDARQPSPAIFVRRRGPDRVHRRCRRRAEPAVADRAREYRDRGCAAWPPGSRRSSSICRTCSTCRRSTRERGCPMKRWTGDGGSGPRGFEPRASDAPNLRTPEASNPSPRSVRSPSTSSTRTIRCGSRCAASRRTRCSRRNSATRRARLLGSRSTPPTRWSPTTGGLIADAVGRAGSTCRVAATSPQRWNGDRARDRRAVRLACAAWAR